MGDYVIRDEILAPREFVVIEYRGPNPFIAYQILNQLLRQWLEVKGTHMHEMDFRWDMTSDPRPFFVQVYAEKGIEKFTKFRVDVKLEGTQPLDSSREGTLRIEFSGFIETKYPTGSFINKAIFWPFYYFYHISYYNARRRRYIEMYRRRIEKIAEHLREALKIPAKPVL